jgi:hypothetical protein
MPTIEFTAYNEETVRNFKPVLAKNCIPEWWKRMRIMDYANGNTNHSIRSCPAMDDWLKSGWLLTSTRDILVLCGNDKNDNDSTRFQSVDLEGRSYEESSSSRSHPAAQFHNVFEYISDDENTMNIKDAFKFRAPWNVVTPEGYSVFYLDPFLFQNKYFAVWQGIIDTDKFHRNMDNSQIIFYPRVNHSFVIPKGTPILQIIPFKREEWVASYQFKDVYEYEKNLSYRIAAYGNEDRDVSKMTMEEANRLHPEFQSEKYKPGAYRSLGYWKPKGKYFNEEAPPPECPFHKKEESAETQLELDFGS